MNWWGKLPRNIDRGVHNFWDGDLTKRCWRRGYRHWLLLGCWRLSLIKNLLFLNSCLLRGFPLSFHDVWRMIWKPIHAEVGHVVALSFQIFRVNFYDLWRISLGENVHLIHFLSFILQFLPGGVSGRFDKDLVNQSHTLQIHPIEELPNIHWDVFHHIQMNEMIYPNILNQNIWNQPTQRDIFPWLHVVYAISNRIF